LAEPANAQPNQGINYTCNHQNVNSYINPNHMQTTNFTHKKTTRSNIMITNE